MDDIDKKPDPDSDSEEKEPDPLEKAKDEKKALLEAWLPKKVDLSHTWIDHSKSISTRSLTRGAVYKCQLGENIGNEQGEYRPVLIVSNTTINDSSGNVVVVPLTKTLRKKMVKGKIVPRYQSHYFLFKDKYSFLTADSALLCEEIKTVSKVRLQEFMGLVDDPAELRRIMSRVQWVLDF